MTLKKHWISASIDFRILKIQLNFKLRWKPHFRQMKTKLMSKHNAANMIKSSIWDTSLAINKQKYIIIEKSMLTHEAVVWYTPSEIKDSRKKITFKLKAIQERALRRLIEVYKITATKTLKIEIYISFINIHLKKLLQNSIININAKRSINAVETAMQRIRKNLMLKKRRKSKLRMISLQAKKRWMRKHLKEAKTTFSQFYIAASWMNSSKIIIEIDKTKTSQTHDSDTSNLR